jgi:hypothetical protein
MLTQQLRQVKLEQSLVDDATAYYTSSSTWVTVKDWGNFVLAQDSIILIQYQLLGVGGARCEARIQLNSVDVHVAGNSGAGGPITYYVMFFLQAGTYDLTALLKYTVSSASVGIQNMKFGTVPFTDLVGGWEAQYATPYGVTVPNRNTPIGPLANATFLANVTAYTAGGLTNMENVGETLTNGVSITVDGVQVSWNNRYQGAGANSDPAWGNAIGKMTVGAAHWFAISKRNANTIVWMSIIGCPWILSDDTAFSPVALAFSQQSTLYIVTEPLANNVSRTVRVGKKRGVSFGTATDYYYSSTGTDIVISSYTFESVSVPDVTLYAFGFPTCISIVGVDIR